MDIGVVIYEDNDSLRETLGSLVTFSKGLFLLGAFSNAVHVIPQIRETNPDVVLMDIDMPGKTGIEAVRNIRLFNQKAQIIMLTIFDDNQHVLDAIIAGASGYLLKKYISDHLVDAITQVIAGEAPMSPGIARMVIESMQQVSKPVGNPYQLTPREKDILQELSTGKSYKLIATDLSISIDTVRIHIKKIYGKLQVHNHVEAINKATKERLL